MTNGQTPEGLNDWLAIFLQKKVMPTESETESLPALNEFMKDENLAEFESRYPKLKLRITDITEYLDALSSTAITKIKDKVKDAHAPAKALWDKLEKGQQPSANEVKDGLTALNPLEAEIKAGVPILKKHDQEVRAYYSTLKKMKKQIEYAEDLRPSTVGTDAWKDQVDAYVAQKGKVITAADAKNYKTANTELAALQTAINTLTYKRLEALNTEITGATGLSGSGTKAKALLDKLKPVEISSMSPETQLDLLGTLRTKIISCNGCGKGMTAKEYKDAGNQCSNTACLDRDNVEKPLKCKSCETPWTGSPCTYNCPSMDKSTWFDCTCGENFKGTPDGECPKCHSSANLTVDADYCDMCGIQRPGVGQCPRHPCGSTNNVIDMDVKNPSRNGRDTGNKKLLESRAKIFANMKMDEEFVEEDKKKRREVVKALHDDDDFKEAESNWEEWINDGDEVKILALLNKIVEKQCKLMGHDKNKKNPGEFPVKVKLKDWNITNGLDEGDYGLTLSGFPTEIWINKLHTGYKNFKEIVDTIIHENSHTWQEWVICMLKGEAPYDAQDTREIKDDPKLHTQAKLFLENDKTYISSDVSQDAYRHEPLEEQAWTFGGSCSQMLLVPQQIRGFKSERGLANKIWMVKSITRKNKATVTLEERHGIYAEEWEGEKAKDKKLFLEIKGTKHKVKIVRRGVVDAYSLKLDFNATDPGVPVKTIAGEGGIIFEDEIKDSKTKALCVKSIEALEGLGKDQIDRLAKKKDFTVAEDGGSYTIKDESEDEARLIVERGTLKVPDELVDGTLDKEVGKLCGKTLADLCKLSIADLKELYKKVVTDYIDTTTFEVNVADGYYKIADPAFVAPLLARLILDESVSDDKNPLK